MSSSPFNIESAYLRYHANVRGAIVQTKQYGKHELNNESFELSFEQADNNVLVFAQLKQELYVELFSVTFKIKKEGTAQYLNRHYQIQEICDEVWNNDLTPLHIQYQYNEQHYLLSNTQGWFSYSAKDESDYLSFTIYLDAAAMHPAWSHKKTERKADAIRLLPVAHQYELSFSINEIDASARPPVLCRYPFGAEAGFIITDHCDYDRADTLQTFLNDWLGKGLKMTKGVFALKSNYSKEGLAATMQDEDYRKLITELYKDGSEVSPHALNQSGQITKEVFDVAFTAISGEYECRTWIDHGSYQKYTYSVGGADNEYRLIDRLKEYAYSSLWSYYDAPINATQSLNIFSGMQISYRSVIKNILRGKIPVAAHYLKTVLEQQAQLNGRKPTLVKLMGALRKNLSGKKSISALKKDIATVVKYSSAQQLPYTAKELNNFSPVLYTESKQPLYQQQEKSLLLFASQEVVHTQDAYTPELLKDLVAERGLHIGHTYLLNTLPYLNGVFNSKKQLSKKWMVFVVALSASVKNGSAWNPTMQEFVVYNKLLSALVFTYTSPRTLLVTNNNATAIEGLTFTIPAIQANKINWGNTPPQVRLLNNKNETIFWGTIPANNSITISW